MSEEHAETAGKEKKNLLAKLRVVAVALAVILLVIVMGQNWGTVTTKILMMEFTMPQALLSLFNFLLGIAVGVLLAFLRPWSKAKS